MIKQGGVFSTNPKVEKLIDASDSLDAMATMDIHGLTKQAEEIKAAVTAGTSKEKSGIASKEMALELIKKENQIKLLEAANRHLQQEDEEEEVEEIIHGKKRLNNLLKLMQKIEATAPEVQKIQEEMKDIKE